MAFQKPSHTFTKIHLKALRTNIFQILFSLSFTVFINTTSFAQEPPKNPEPIRPKVERDTAKTAVDSLIGKPVQLMETDSILPDSLPKKREFLSDVVTYKATDYVSLDRKEQKIYMYNEAEVHYQDMDIKSGVIVIDNRKNLVYAGRIKDTAGNYSQKPVFKQKNNVIEPDSIIFNIKSQKAFNSITEQQGGTIIAEVTKKENDSVYFIKRGKFTTAENLEDPEYYILMRKAKIVPGKKIVTGLSNLFFYDVPTPIGVPFAYFPLTNKRTSGILMPTPGEDNTRGYSLQNGGYYFAISDYADLTVLGDIYTNGSYSLNLSSNYALRYKFRGNLSFRYENIIQSERGFPDYSKSTIYNIRWSHNQDTKASPNSRFSASVNLGSSRYYQQSRNQLNIPNAQNNTLSSSVSYSKTFLGEPQVNMSITATHSQNTNTQRIDMTLPTFQGSVSRIYPFAPKVGTKKGIIQNINFQYSVRGENRIQTTDSLFFKKGMFDDAKVGIQHSIPISTNFKIFKYFSMSASTNFQENWTMKTIRKYYDNNLNQVVTEDVNGFDSFRTYNFSASIGTTIYGMFDFKKEGKNPKIQAIRHVMTPTISYNINPAFDQYYETYEVIDANGTTSEEYSRFEKYLFGAPSNHFSSSMGISLSNNIEAKIRPKDSTETEPKKIKLLNSLNFSTSYNFAADSLRWSPVRVTGSTSLLDSKMSVNFGATLDPYALDSNNRKIGKFNIENGGSLFRVTSANLTLNYSFSSKNSKKKSEDKSSDDNTRSGGRDDDLFGKAEDFSNQSLGDQDKDKSKENVALYNYKIPWNIRVAYAVNYINTARQNQISSHSLMFSGDIELSPNWKVGASSSYDIKNKGFGLTQLRFERDLLSWHMNFSWVPFGTYGSWNFFIGIKSNLLKDLKYEKHKQRDIQL